MPRLRIVFFPCLACRSKTFSSFVQAGRLEPDPRGRLRRARQGYGEGEDPGNHTPPYFVQYRLPALLGRVSIGTLAWADGEGVFVTVPVAMVL